MLGKTIHYIISKIRIHRSLNREKNKINDIRRQKILENYVLTPEQKLQIDNLFAKTYGKKIPYDWHRYFSSYTGRFDVNYIPELLYIPIIEKKFNDDAYIKAFSDKNLLPYYVGNEDGIRTPEIYLSAVNGIMRNSKNDIVDYAQARELLKDVTCFGKPTVDSNSGKMCAVYQFENYIDNKSNKDANQIIREMGKDFCFQEIISNCESVKKIHPQSLNTFRITTYLWDNEVQHFPIIMRIGKGEAVLDNAHQGGMFIGVTDDGYLTDCAFTEFQERYFVHPDSDIEFKDYQIPETKLALEATKKIHARIPQIGMISWDVVVNDKNEVIIIEMNVKGQSVWLPQMAHGVGAFGENTVDILKWISK